MDKGELLKAGLMLVVIYAEYRAMQAYNDPVMASIWRKIYLACYKIAAFFGQLGIMAEHNYYIAVETGA